MPGIFRYNIEEALDISLKAKELGINAVALFPEVPKELKDESGTEGLKANNIICNL